MRHTLGIITERTPREHRVAVDPAIAARLVGAGVEVVVERGAGAPAGHPDESWKDCRMAADAAEVVGQADILPVVLRPGEDVLDALRPGSVLVGLIAPYRDFEILKKAAARGVSILAMELVPRISRAQSMDALSSQATVAGYQAVIIAADLSPRLFPMLTTAAGTLRPVKVVVIGAGVAGLQAIATARRLGGQVEAYDIRSAAREQVESLGAKMIDTGVDAESEGGYARELSEEEKGQQAEVLAGHLAAADVVISTAAVPGRLAPKIITADMVKGMRAGSVIVDVAAEAGGNCELTRAGETVVERGVIIDGPLGLPSRCALHASEMYAKNIYNLLTTFITDGKLVIDPDDEVIAACLLAHGGEVVHEKFK